MTVHDTINELTAAADQLEAADCDANAKRLRSLADYLGHALTAIDTVRPIIEMAATGDRDAIRAAVEQHREATYEAIENHLYYCPYDCDHCHDTDTCGCPNCTSYRDGDDDPGPSVFRARVMRITELDADGTPTGRSRVMEGFFQSALTDGEPESDLQVQFHGADPSDLLNTPIAVEMWEEIPTFTPNQNQAWAYIVFGRVEQPATVETATGPDGMVYGSFTTCTVRPNRFPDVGENTIGHMAVVYTAPPQVTP